MRVQAAFFIWGNCDFNRTSLWRFIVGKELSNMSSNKVNHFKLALREMWGAIFVVALVSAAATLVVLQPLPDCFKLAGKVLSQNLA